jgi:WD40 repeat protein
MAGDMLVSATRQGVIRRWDRSGLEIGPPLTGHPWPVHRLIAVAGDPATVLSAASDGMRAWDVATGDPLGDGTADPVPAHDGAAGVRLGDGRLIFASSAGTSLSRHDILAGTTTAEPIGDESDEITVADVAAVALPGGSGLIVATTTAGEIVRFDAASGRRIAGARIGGGVPFPHGNEWYAVAATTLPDGTVLIAGPGDGNRIQRWNAVTGEPIGAPLHGTGLVVSLTFRALPDVVLLISCDDGGLVQRWNAATGRPVGEILSVNEDPSVPLAPAAIDADRLIAASSGQRTRCWDAATGDHLGDIANAVCNAVLTLPDGRVVLAVGLEDGGVEIIRMPSSLAFNVTLPL